jgi:hypothetical protein
MGDRKQVGNPFHFYLVKRHMLFDRKTAPAASNAVCSQSYPRQGIERLKSSLQGIEGAFRLFYSPLIQCVKEN